jgi:Leucine-rich repeat (LRR) protein
VSDSSLHLKPHFYKKTNYYNKITHKHTHTPTHGTRARILRGFFDMNNNNAAGSDRKGSMSNDRMIYEGLPYGQSKNSVDDPFGLHEATSHRDIQRRHARPKPKKAKSRSSDVGSVDSPGSNHKTTPKTTKNKGIKTRVKEERAKVSSEKQNKPRERGFKHQNNFETPISAAFLPPEVIEITRQLSYSYSSIVEEINLSYRALTTVEYGFIDLQVKRVSSIDVSHNNLQTFPDCFQLSSLKCINFASNQLKYLALKNRMSNLSLLVLSSNKIETFPSAETLQHLPSLRRLILHNNKIKKIHPASLKKLGEIGLIDLNLSFNRLKVLPDEICDVTSLRSLHLMTNVLVSLPSTITRISSLEKLDVVGNKLTSPPQEVASRGIDAVKRYFQELQKESEAYEKKFGHSVAPERFRSSQFKLIVVGHQRTGKTSSIRCLTRSIVKVNLSGGGQCYGKLKGMYDDGRYEVMLLGEGGRHAAASTTAAATGARLSPGAMKSEWQDRQEDFFGDEEDDDNVEGEEYRSDCGYEDGPGGQGGHVRWRECSRMGRIIKCREEDIEMCGPAMCGGGECGDGDGHDKEFWDALAPPASTIGIDIDMWRPAFTYNLLRNKALKANGDGGGYNTSGQVLSATNDIGEKLAQDLILSIW